MSKFQKKPKSCFYPCPCECAETAGFVKNTPAIASMQESGIAGYDLVYIADLASKHIFMFGTPNGVWKGEELDLSCQVHEKPHQQASQAEVVSYEWSVNTHDQTHFFQSTLLPLKDNTGKVGSILGLVKDISLWGGDLKQNHLLKEGARRTFSQILLAAREEEKRKISSALHDEIGSAAVILTSLLSLVKQSLLSGDQEQALKDISSLDQEIKKSIERVKNIVISLRPPNLEEVGLADALQELLFGLTQYKNIKHSFKLQTEDDLPVSREVSIVLYRVAQESLNNIIKHAEASKVDISLKIRKNEVILKISDNGKGFKVSKQRSIKHIGLLSMRDSVAYLGGKFTIQSELGKGTVLKAVCPKIVYGVGEL